jgi:7,8-dihydroneopterin aldolase/epimerase/oxygenase
MMLKISLHEAEFFARHGYYAEEQILGNYFIVNIEATFNPQTSKLDDDLNNTLNYEYLYTITAQQMKQTRQLLESVAQGIADEVMNQFPYILHLTVEVKKRNPPLKGRVAATGVKVVVDTAA